MAVTTAAALKVGTMAATTGMSFYQASQARKMQVKAQEHASKAIEDARKRLDVNFFDTLSVVKEPYELEREAALTQGAQAIEAARESTRGVAGTAGRVQMAQNLAQRQIAGQMGREAMELERLSATEQSRLRDENVIIDLGEARGAQLAAANAWEMNQRALMQGLMGVTGTGSAVADAMPMDRSKVNLQTGVETPQTNQPKFGGTYNIQDPNVIAPNEFEGRQLNPQYQGMSYQQIIEALQGQGLVSPTDIDYGQIFNLIYN